jgi:hypothetical protein
MNLDLFTLALLFTLELNAAMVVCPDEVAA